MAIRDKIKAKFSKKRSSSGDSTPSSQSSIPGHYTGRTDIEYYKPHEIPKSKYRGKVDKAHQERLDAYSFGDAFQQVKRKTSTAFSGTFSPGGTKAFSRRTSYASHAGAMTPARRSSISSATDGGSFSVPSSGSQSTRLTALSGSNTGDSLTRANTNEEADTAKNDLSRIGTAKDQSRPETATATNIPTVRLDRQATVTEKTAGLQWNHDHIEHSRLSNDTPFTPDELTRAISRAAISAH